MDLKRPSSIRDDGVAGVLERVRVAAMERMRERLTERGASVDLYTEVEIEHVSRLAGTIAKNAAADGIAESYQMGVNRSVTNEELEAPTVQRKAPGL